MNRNRSNGPHHTQRILAPPKPTLKAFQLKATMKAVHAVGKHGLLDLPYDRDHLAFFSNLFVIGTPTQPFSHTVYPLGPKLSRGVVRIYWASADSNASERFAREYSLAQVRDIHCEDISIIERGQRGLSSGALEHIHFQSMEALCRHIFLEVDARFEDHARSIGESA